MGLRIKLLGQFEVYRDGQPIAQTEWRTEKNKDLLKILALYPDQVLSQDWLMESLWPDQDPARSVRNLRGRISEIRRILEPRLSRGSGSAYVKTVSTGYTLDASRCRIDTEVFQECYRRGITQADLNTDSAIKEFKRAVEIYIGDLLPSDRHAEWTFERRDELRRLYLEAIRQLTELLYRDQEYNEAIRYGERALQADPYDERIYRTLMRAHHEMGNVHAALRLYERCRRALEASDMGPSGATEHLFETLRHQAYRFSEQVSIENQLQTIADRLSSERDPEVRWDLLGQQINHLHALRRHSEEADALEAAEALAREMADAGKLGRVFIKWADHRRARGDLEASERAARRAQEHFASIDDPLGLAEADFVLGRCHSSRRDAQGAYEHYARALEGVQSIDGVRADQIRIRLWAQLGQLAVNRQRYDDALAHYDQAMRLSQAIEDYAEQARLFLRLGSLYYYRDLVAEAGVHWEHGRQLARRIGHQEIEVKCLNNLAVHKKNQADLTAAWGLYETVLEVQERLHDVEGLAKSWNNLGIIHDTLGEREKALDAFDQSRQYSEAAGDELGIAVEEMNIASVHIHQERFEEAQARLEGALEVFRTHESAWYEIQALYYRGELDLARAQPREARAWLDHALELAHKIRSHKLAEHIRAALAVVELDLGHEAKALKWAQAVESTLAETPPGVDDTRVLYRLYQVFSDVDMDSQAQRHLKKAHDLVDHLASQLTDPKTREAFERVSLYRDILDAYRRSSSE